MSVATTLGSASHSSWKELNSSKMSFSIAVELGSSSASVIGGLLDWCGVRDSGTGVLKSIVKGVPCGAAKTSVGARRFSWGGERGLALFLARGLFWAGWEAGGSFFFLVT